MKRRVDFSLLALVLAIVFGGQSTMVLAGTTGGLNGSALTTSGAPVGGAKVTAASPSQIATTTTDDKGHFAFLNLAPDSYTVSVEKEGLNPLSLAGVTVTADNNATIALKLESLRTIGRVSARATGDLVRPGVTNDVYSVGAAQAAKATALGGGGSQDSSYSAIQSVPGVNVPAGQVGWNQSVHIRGAAASTTGYEYDGIPVNRAFDNYAAHTASNLGQQELQVYTGGGPASSSSAGISGFINDVIKSGTYPGSESGNLSVGGPAFYHQGKIELSGATQNRNFSYYVGISGYNQSFRYGDQFNGASLAGPSEEFGAYSPINVATFTGQGIAGLCDSVGNAPPAEIKLPSNAGCFTSYNGFLLNEISDITDRENVVNLHLGIPHKNGLKDDIQFLASASALRTLFYSSPDDLGPGVAQFYLANTGSPYVRARTPGASDPTMGIYNYPHYADTFVYDAPFGTPVSTLTPHVYLQPSSPQNRAPFAPLPSDGRDLFNNDTGIFKLAYTHNFSDKLYARLFGYTFFSDWTQAGAVNAWANGNEVISTGAVSPNYDLITHTAGADLQIGDQVTSTNLIQLNADYVRANVSRFNNTGFLGQPAQTGLFSKDAKGQYHCFSAADQTEVPCYRGSFKGDAVTNPAFGGSPEDPYGGTTGLVTGAAAAAGASWKTIWDGEADGTANTVGPRFNSISLTDQYKPNLKLTLNAGLRFDNFQYKLANTVRPANDFYTQIVQNYACYDPLTNTVNLAPLGPTTPPPPGIVYTAGPCAPELVGGALHNFVHPNGTVQDGVASRLFTDESPASYTLQYFSPRVSLSYALSQDTVLRGSIGRFAEPPISAAVQYDRKAGRAATSLLANSFIPLGFFSPFHDIAGQTSENADFSLEQHIPNSDISFKASPYYRRTSNYSQDVLIGQNFVTHIPVGDATDYGLEFAITKGNFDRNGFSGQVAYTYTNSKVHYTDISGPGTGQISQINLGISQYNALTKSARCYKPATTNAAGTFVPGVPDPGCAATDILNPYFGKPSQPLLDPNGSYVPYSTALAFTYANDIGSVQYTAPHVVVALVNYRHDKFAVTPSLQFATGTFYGSPTDVTGLDPRTCTANSAASGYKTAPSPLQADYVSCAAPAITPTGALFIPNPETGHFDSLGTFQQPSLLTANVNLSYNVNKTVTANVLFSNFYHNCFGGSKAAWTQTFAPNANTCEYLNNPYYASNFYNGSGPNDVVANGVKPLPNLTHSFEPSYTAEPLPFSVYGSLSFKI